MPADTSISTENFFVVTGGPGSGKTTLIEALAAAGHAVCEEAGRGVILDQRAIGGPALPWSDPAAFAAQMLGWEMRSHRMAGHRPGTVFFDRGVPDVIGYLRLSGLPVPAHVTAAAAAFRYNRRVLIAPPWPEIFTQDGERRQDIGEAVRTYEAMVATYGDCGYDLVELPRTGVAERVRFVLSHAAASRQGEEGDGARAGTHQRR